MQCWLSEFDCKFDDYVVHLNASIIQCINVFIHRSTIFFTSIRHQ